MLKLALDPEEVYRDSTNPIFSDVRDEICHLQTGSYQVQYRLTHSLKQVFSTHTAIRELLQRRDIVEALKEVADLTRVPNQYLGLSIREMAAQHGGMSEEQLDAMDVILESV